MLLLLVLIICRTPYFMAPEVLSENKYGRKGDIWAVGCTMIQMLTGSPPWKDQNLKNLVQLHILLSSWKLGPPPYTPASDISEECRECISLCFQKDETKRPNTTELLKCHFFVKYDSEDMLSEPLFDSPETKAMKSIIPRNAYDNEDNESFEILETSGVMTNIREQLNRAVIRSTTTPFTAVIEKAVHIPLPSVSEIKEEYWHCSKCNTPNKMSTSICNQCKYSKNDVRESRSVNPFQYGATRVSREVNHIQMLMYL